MAEIAPIRGILYNPEKVNVSDVLAPPYDVIDDEGRAALMKQAKHNCVRLILPKGKTDRRYSTAASTFDKWLEAGILARDERPAIYRYHQVFDVADLGRTVIRRGFIAGVKLHPFDAGVILPHERTLKGPKIDRLKLMKATNAHFSQIFTMYRDPSGETDRVFSGIETDAPYLEGTTEDGTIHRVWRVFDRELIGKLQRLMSSQKLYIADGHHRYETMLALREHYRETNGSLSQHSSAQFGTMFLANMNDAGLIVLPTHRMVFGLEGFTEEVILAKAAEYFEIGEVVGGATDSVRLREAIATARPGQTTFGAVFPGNADAYTLAVKSSVNLAALGTPVHSTLAKLDVTLLHELLLDRVLGIDRAAQEAQTNLRYIKDTEKALGMNANGEGQVTFIMNPTQVNQVKAVADAGQVMPQKSTYFFPKIASGVLFHRVEPDAELY